MTAHNTRTARRVLLTLNIAAIVAVLCFIFGNSLLNGQQSGEVSSSVMEAVEPIARPIVEAVSPKPVTDDMLHTVIRKLAHFTEFAALAALSALLLFQLRGTLMTPHLGYVLFGTLLAAVTDEFIQSFTGRTSSVRDVLIDFSGALCGMLLTAAVLAIVRACRQKRTL